MTFLVFAGQAYYARGGAFDVIAVETVLQSAIEKADQALEPHLIEWAHVLNTETLQVIYQVGMAFGQWSDTVAGQTVPLDSPHDLWDDE